MSIDLPALSRLAADSVPREELIGSWWSLCASTALHHVGYTVRYWLRCDASPDGKRDTLLEYRPRAQYEYTGQAPKSIHHPPHTRETRDESLPRMTATSYARQCEIHRALGLHVVGRDHEWRPLPAGQMALPFEEREAA